MAAHALWYRLAGTCVHLCSLWSIFRYCKASVGDFTLATVIEHHVRVSRWCFFPALILSHQLWSVNADSSHASFSFVVASGAKRDFFFMGMSGISHSLILVGACPCETGPGLDSEVHWDCEQLTRLACSNEYCWQSFNRDGKACKRACEQQP